jgi:hypothetical protein
VTQASEQMDSAKLRKELALAERHEMVLAVQRGEYVHRSAVEEGRVRRILAVKEALYRLVESGGEEMENRPAPEIKERLRNLVEVILRHFSGPEIPSESDSGPT